MAVHKVDNIFSDEELDFFYRVGDSIDESQINDTSLGRILKSVNLNDMPESIQEKLNKIVGDITGKSLSPSHALYAEYSAQYGQPNLPPHFDGDINDLVVDFQLSSNTRWDLGVDTKNYQLEDNSALFFNANEHVHWRPYKTFKDGEFVKMIFIRYYDTKRPSDYSHLNLSQNDPIFLPAVEFRNSLGQQ